MNLILWGIVLLGIYVQQSVSQKVQCYSEFSSGKCNDLLGEVEKDDCCMNPNYGYAQADGVCMYCGPAAWTEWSSWGECSVSCTEGVMQRRRSCYGIGNGNCLDPEKLGTLQTKPCLKQNCCPVEGGWSEWEKWQPCSVTCEMGLKKRRRHCNNPVPQCGGSCMGEEEEITSCNTEIICPTHGGWSGWGSWVPCPVTCASEGDKNQEELRKRMCTNPIPSTIPRGRDCEGSDTDTRPCSGIPFCPVDGNWGAWSGFTPCSVTCGVGKQKQRRLCDSPTPKHGGKKCQGEEQRNSICTTAVPCPIHGMWSEWSQWSPCKKYSTREIKCRTREGRRIRERFCNYRKHGGNFCEGDVSDHGSCYDISECRMDGVLSEWSEWSYCKPNCGPNSVQTSERKCVPDVSKYSSNDLSLFSGQPIMNCMDLKDEIRTKPCKNVPECKGMQSPELRTRGPAEEPQD